MGRKKKKIGRTWIRRKRRIKGKERYVYVRKIDGKYQTRMHKPEVHGRALALQIQGKRTPQAKSMDRARSHKKTIRPTDKALKSYKKRPGSADIKSIDTKKRKRK